MLTRRRKSEHEDLKRNNMIDVKKFDKLIKIEKDLSWRITLKRKSPLNKWIEYDIMSIENMLVKSWRYIRYKLHLMDTRKRDIIREILNSNSKMQKDNDREMAKEVSKIFTDINIKI